MDSDGEAEQETENIAQHNHTGSLFTPILNFKEYYKTLAFDGIVWSVVFCMINYLSVYTCVLATPAKEVKPMGIHCMIFTPYSVTVQTFATMA